MSNISWFYHSDSGPSPFSISPIQYSNPNYHPCVHPSIPKIPKTKTSECGTYRFRIIYRTKKKHYCQVSMLCFCAVIPIPKLITFTQSQNAGPGQGSLKHRNTLHKRSLNICKPHRQTVQYCIIAQENR